MLRILGWSVEHRKRSVGAEPWEQKHKEFFSSLPKAGAQPLFFGAERLRKMGYTNTENALNGLTSSVFLCP
jgi:hypothetical protein